ncbi:MAG: NAD(+)/NADH kinase [Ignavibacteria bacterium]|nr:NAD(+)/NADH kinase [Ignavibacteria bacterium]
MTFGIRGNIYKPETGTVVQKMIDYMKSRGVTCFVENSLRPLLKAKGYSGFFKSPAKLISSSDFVISVGGDGTFLSTAAVVGSSGVPVIGVNLGKLGFLAETPVSRVNLFIDDILAGKYKTEERTVLEASVEGYRKILHGINEIVINQSGVVKTIEISVLYNNQPVNSYHADGLIVATPAGSTGYALSAGGPVVHPSTGVMILCPLSAHTLTARPVILPDSGTFRIKVTSRIPIYLIADGNVSLKLKSPAEIEIKKAPYTLKVAKPLSSNYFRILRSKLFWGHDKRKSHKGTAD